MGDAKIIELLGSNGNPIEMTCAESTSIDKGTLLQLTNPRTASAASAANQDFGGVASMDKLAGDGSTKISVYTYGIFEFTAGEAISTGANVRIHSTGKVGTTTTLKQAFGRALTNASIDGAVEVLVGGFN